ncbi:MAG: RSP_2647 family RNA methyltransferase [Maritimibacter sp.]
MTQTRPIIRLRPNVKPQKIRHGFPWAYENEIVTDRRSKAITPGAIAQLQDANREPMATVAVNPNSRIFARVLDANPDANIDGAWLRAKLVTALAHRARLYDAPFYRLIHAEADGMPGVIMDRFGDTVVFQPNAAWAETLSEDIADALIELDGIKNVIKNASGRSRALEGLSDASETLRGTPPAQIEVPMNGATYIADLEGGQKTGLYFDQRPNHAFAAKLAGEGGDVLDVFSHVGGFSLAALAQGAGSALAVDGSQGALDLATQGASAMGVSAAFSTQKSDAFAALEALGEAGRQFDLVVCDPPAFAPSKKALEAGLRAYNRVARLATPLVKPGGYLVLCSCSHAAELEKFRAASIRGIGQSGARAQMVHTGLAGADHPTHPSLAESGYLKSLFFRILP